MRLSTLCDQNLLKRASRRGVQVHGDGKQKERKQNDTVVRKEDEQKDFGMCFFLSAYICVFQRLLYAHAQYFETQRERERERKRVSGLLVVRFIDALLLRPDVFAL